MVFRGVDPRSSRPLSELRGGHKPAERGHESSVGPQGGQAQIQHERARGPQLASRATRRDCKWLQTSAKGPGVFIWAWGRPGAIANERKSVRETREGDAAGAGGDQTLQYSKWPQDSGKRPGALSWSLCRPGAIPNERKPAQTSQGAQLAPGGTASANTPGLLSWARGRPVAPANEQKTTQTSQ